MLRILFVIALGINVGTTFAQTDSLKPFDHWQTGHDDKTIQVIPSNGDDPVTIEDGQKIVHVKFRVRQYGEVSFPIDPSTPRNTEAKRVDLADKKLIKITYSANEKFILQLRQTGVHGGVHHHVTIPPSDSLTTIEVLFSDFKGGKTPLDLSDVAKFNFAFLSNHARDGFAALRITKISIE